MTTKFIVIFTLLFSSSISFGLGRVAVLSVGSNLSFDRSLTPLNFAANDSSRFAEAMETAGLVDHLNIHLLKNPNLEDFYRAVDKIKATGAETQKFIFYFSGHSDERGLHFRDGLLSKRALHTFLAGISAKTKVVLLDSCYSGSLASKGVEAVAAFEIPKMNYDEPTGSVFLTAASATDIAIESRLLKGSLFTNNIIEGLYGSADGNNDGVVTATELYQYAFRETKLQSFAYPVEKVQAPEFVADLKGKGAIALSFPALTNGKLLLDFDVMGSLAIAHKRGLQFFKVEKHQNKRKLLHLPAGEYDLTLKHKGRVGKASVEVQKDRLYAINSSNFDWSGVGSKKDMRQKGSSASTIRKTRFAAGAGLLFSHDRQTSQALFSGQMLTNPRVLYSFMKTAFGLKIDVATDEPDLFMHLGVEEELWFYDTFAVGVGIGYARVKRSPGSLDIAAGETGLKLKLWDNGANEAGLSYRYVFSLGGTTPAKKEMGHNNLLSTYWTF